MTDGPEAGRPVDRGPATNAPGGDRQPVDHPLVDRPLVDRPLVDRPLVDLSAETRAAQAIADRSRSAGIWSLGHLRICWAALLVGALVLGVAGAVVAGSGAVLGVLLGTVIVGAFFTFSAVVIAWVGKTNPKTVMVAALFAYVIKVLVLAIVLMTMPIDGPIDVKWMAGSIGLGLFLWLGAHMRYVWTLKLYYVDPG